MKAILTITRPNTTAIFILFVSMLSFNVNAQYRFYRGLTASFGMHSLTSGSNIHQIDRTPVAVAGGQVGVVIGKDVVQYEIGLVGYYSSVNNVVGTVDLHTNNIAIKFFPLHLLGLQKPWLNPYMNAGVSYDRFKFHGHYTNPDAAKMNYSGNTPYIGAIRQINATMGAGLNFRMWDDEYSVVNLFTEMKYVYSLNSVSTRRVLGNTSLANHLLVNVGVSFGIRD
jgi:hypothetical protein